MNKKRLIPTLVVVFTFAFGALQMATAVPAFAASSQTLPSSSICSAVSIVLHGGHNNFSAACLHTRNAGGKIQPDTFIDLCYNSNLQLWSNSSYGGYELCLSGTGSFDLTGYPYGYQWNDVMSSFKTGSYWGSMYRDTGDGGPNIYFQPNMSCNNMGYVSSSHTSDGSTNWNDRVSSVYIGGTYSNSYNNC